MPQNKASVRKGITKHWPDWLTGYRRWSSTPCAKQWARIEMMESEIATIEQRISCGSRTTMPAKRIAEIPGVGPLTATAAVAIMGDTRHQVRTGVCSIRRTGAQADGHGWADQTPGDQQTRGYLPANAPDPRRSVRADYTRNWVRGSELRQRRPLNVAVVALANKMADDLGNAGP